MQDKDGKVIKGSSLDKPKLMLYWGKVFTGCSLHNLRNVKVSVLRRAYDMVIEGRTAQQISKELPEIDQLRLINEANRLKVEVADSSYRELKKKLDKARSGEEEEESEEQ